MLIWDYLICNELSDVVTLQIHNACCLIITVVILKEP